MGGWVPKFARAVLDPAGIMGGDGQDGGAVPPREGPSAWEAIPQMIRGAAQTAQDQNKSRQAKENYDGFLGNMMPADWRLAAYSADAKPAQAPYQAQWQYSAGKGPQWTEPEQTYDRNGGDQWRSKVNNGPAKGNRF